MKAQTNLGGAHHAQIVLGCQKKQVEQGMGSRPVCSTGHLHQHLPPRCCIWALTPTFISDGQWCGRVSWLWCLVTAPETLRHGVKCSSCSFTGRQLFTRTQYKSVFAPLVFLWNYLQIIMIWSIISGFSFCFDSFTHIFFSVLMSYIWWHFYKKSWWKVPYCFQPWYP